MRKILLFLFSFLIGIGLFILVRKSIDLQELRRALLVFTVWQGLVILALTFIIQLDRAFRLKVILNSQKRKVSISELARIYIAGRSIAFFAPTLVLADEAFVGYTLREKRSIPWKSYLIVFIIDKILYFAGFFAVVFLGLGFFLLKIGLPPQTLAIILGVLFFFAVLIFFFYFKCFKKQSLIEFFIGILGKELKGDDGDKAMEIEEKVLSFFDRKQKYLWEGLALTLFFEIFHIARCWILMDFLVKGIGIIPVLIISSFLHLATAIPIPAALGSHEALQVLSFNYLGLKASTATAFTMIVRGAELIMALAGAFFLFQFGIELVKIVLFKKIGEFLNNKNGKNNHNYN